MKIHESAENYLETILMIRNEKGFARSIDVANELGFTKPSVSVAMKNLREAGYITVESGGNILLTDKGRDIADRMYERHQLIAKALIALGVDSKTAYEDSCKIEHDISDISFEKIKELILKHIKEI